MICPSSTAWQPPFRTIAFLGNDRFTDRLPVKSDQGFTLGKLRREWEQERLKASSLPFDEWLEFIRVDMSDLDWNSDNEDLLQRITKFFRLARELAATYSAEDLNALLWKFAGETGFLQVLFEDTLSLEKRQECIEAMKCLYTDVFQEKCTRALSHGLPEHPPDFSPLNSICYMWWDLFPCWGAAETSQNKTINLALLKLMREILLIEHEACQESALHGLGHWHHRYPGQTIEIIDDFLSSHKVIAPLKDYARAARCGCVN